jgi:hypothetical protein
MTSEIMRVRNPGWESICVLSLQGFATGEEPGAGESSKHGNERLVIAGLGSLGTVAILARSTLQVLLPAA